MTEADSPRHWDSIALAELALEFLNGGTPSTKQAAYWDGDIPWTTSARIAEDDLYIDRGQRFITQKGLQNSATNLVPKGNLLVATRVGVGKAAMNLIDIAISQDLTGVLLDHSKVDPEFVTLQLKSQEKQSYFDGRKRGATIQGITRDDLETLEIAVPPLPEQRAIARALRAVQEAKEARRRELALERERKAALMQFLFTHGTCGERLKQSEIGHIPMTWRVVSLGDLSRSVPQNGAFVKNPQLGSGTLYVNVYDTYQNIIVDLNTVQRLQCNSSVVERYSLEENDLLFVRSSLKREGVGQCCLFPGSDEKVIFDCHLIKVSPNAEVVDPLYLTYYFSTEKGRDDLIARSKTTTMTTINQKALLQSLVILPSFSEQREIVSIMRACDTKIAALERESGLSDELFRAMLEELMTGCLSAMPLIKEGAAQ